MSPWSSLLLVSQSIGLSLVFSEILHQDGGQEIEKKMTQLQFWMKNFRHRIKGILLRGSKGPEGVKCAKIAKTAILALFCTINSTENKNSKIYSDNFFCIPKTYLHANFQKIWSKTKKPQGFKFRFFQTPDQNPVFLPVSYSNLSSEGWPSNVQKLWSDESWETNEHFFKPGKVAL